MVVFIFILVLIYLTVPFKKISFNYKVLSEALIYSCVFLTYELAFKQISFSILWLFVIKGFYNKVSIKLGGQLYPF